MDERIDVLAGSQVFTKTPSVVRPSYLCDTCQNRVIRDQTIARGQPVRLDRGDHRTRGIVDFGGPRMLALYRGFLTKNFNFPTRLNTEGV